MPGRAALVFLLLLTFSASSVHVDARSACARDAACEGIRPGARLLNGCTMAWVLRDENAVYITTAGHCVGEGMRMTMEGVGEFGTVVVREASGLGLDYAVIRIDPTMAPLVDPTMCAFGGPAASAARAEPGLAYRMYGWGEGAAEPARTGPEAAPPAEFLLWGSRVRPGDSGAPVMSLDGRAMGIATHAVTLGPLGTPVLDPTGDAAAGTPLWRVLAGAREAGLRLSLVAGNGSPGPQGLLPAGGGLTAFRQSS